MPARSSVSPALVKHDVESCTDVSAIFSLFHKLNYPVEPVPVHIPLEVEDLPRSLRDGIAARYPVAQVGGSYPGESFLSVTCFSLKSHARKSAIIRGVSQAWTRRFLGEHLLVFTVNDTLAQNTIEQIAFVNIRRLGEGAHVRMKLHKLLVERRNPTRHDLDTLNRIALPSQGLSAENLGKCPGK